MILLAYSFLDNKTGHYSMPFFFNHRGHAVRCAIELGSDPKTTLGRHPADFTLCEIGVFDDQTGRMTSETTLALGTVASFLGNLPKPTGLFDQLQAKPNGELPHGVTIESKNAPLIGE